jgi:hypothetical protein
MTKAELKRENASLRKMVDEYQGAIERGELVRVKVPELPEKEKA